ncbi:MAG TPA: polyphosphate kinase 2 family protein [Methanoregulaceae archaeon]|nr:polyphosphate kinase 2 family protein [Methanoregulaceae archaeon]
MIKDKIIRKLKVRPGKRVRLNEFITGWEANEEMRDAGKDAVKERAGELLEESRASLSKAQELLWAGNTWSVLVILQGMDTAGKDGTIKHVMSGVNPQGCRVTSFKVPTPEETDHNFLWRYSVKLPERGEIGVFNRSYYEDVLVVRVHPDLLDNQQLPAGKRGNRFWNERFEDINGFEQHLVRNGTLILKFFLHISKEEQKRRLLGRLDNNAKYWKFSLSDLSERQYWDEYQEAYEIMLGKTSTGYAPWWIIPADYKWRARTLVSDIITREIERLPLHYPEVSPEQMDQITTARDKLLQE